MLIDQGDFWADARAAVERVVERAPNRSKYELVRVDGELVAEEILPGLMYRFHELTTDRHRQTVALTVYIGIGTFGAALWRQEMTTLERLSSVGHSALPLLLDGGFLPDEDNASRGVAYIRTRRAIPVTGENHDRSNVASFMARRRGDAIRHLWLLADALSIIHDSRVVHRALWSGAIEQDLVGNARESTDEDVQAAGLRVQLARFEMSGMFSNLLRNRRAGRVASDDVRSFYMERLPERSRVFAPPSRLRFMFGDGESSTDPFRADIFGLAMVAVEWLLGPEMLGAPEDWESLQSVLDLQARIRQAVRTSDLPQELSSELDLMLDENAVRRSAFEVVGVLGRTHQGALTEFDADAAGSLPFLVAFMPGAERSDKTLFRWGHITESSGTEGGLEELTALIEEDMRGARVLFSPEGAGPYVEDNDREKRREATTVIRGKNFVWFLMEMHKNFGLGETRQYKATQIVRYVVEVGRINRSLEDFLRRGLSRSLRAVRAVNFDDPPEVLTALEEGRPLWAPFLKPISVGAPVPDELVQRRRTMEWYLEYQSALLRSREYAYQVVEGAGTPTPQIEADFETEAYRLDDVHDPLVHALLSSKDRPAMVDFVTAEDDRDAPAMELQLAGEGTKLNKGMRVKVNSKRGTRRLVLDAPGPIPLTGWLRVASDGLTERQLDNHRDAVAELAERRGLLAQLTMPASRPQDAWFWADAGGDLIGEGGLVVEEMLSHEPFYALQGPPGTGKTTITSQAVATYLRREPSARVLISAQSNDALDNLAERILSNLGIRPGGPNGELTALRVSSRRRTDPVAETIKPYLEDSATGEMLRSIGKRTRAWLSTPTSKPEVVPVLQEWLALKDSLGLDLRYRLRRGANLVFATTGASTRRNLVERGSSEPFDWVIVEEAARAWPTELVMPLIRGNKWTVIGDQAQIGAYGRADVERLLASFHNDPDPELKSLADNRAYYAEGFDLFASLFDIDGEHSWRRILREQYRMDERIAAIVSTTFYKKSNGLDSPRGRRPHDLDRTLAFLDHAVVWVDTEGRKRASGRWSNEDEAKDVAAIVNRIRPDLERAKKTYAVLTPYREQIKQFERHLAGDRNVYTIDGFQGREADVIIASMVRDRLIDPAVPRANIGHVIDSGRANVLLSRARSLLIMVGDLDLFENYADKEWKEVVQTIREQGNVVTLSEVVSR